MCDKEVALFSRWPIFHKLLLGVAMLILIVTVLSFSGFRGVYSFKGLAKSIRVRAGDLPLTQELTQRVGDLHVTLSRVRHTHETSSDTVQSSFDSQILRQEFHTNFLAVQDTLRRYRQQLDVNIPSEPRITDNRQERETAGKIEIVLRRIEQTNQTQDWMFDDVKVEALEEELQNLQKLSSRLPTYLQQRMHDFVLDARSQYRTWIALNWVTSASAILILILLGVRYYRWIVHPLQILIHGSRCVAEGDFDHRIQLDSQDEMSELAGAMNEMTANFQEIRDDLNSQVQQRTKEVVQNEKMASVGFLAAGVAHEINNPLASVAWCAESLELRLHDALALLDDDAIDSDATGSDERGVELDADDVAALKKNLRTIQDEAFRCKGITESLLNFSRMGDVEKQPTSLHELVEGVIDMVRRLGKYREKKIEFIGDGSVVASINPQEIKQVVLNLITNALDSLQPGGRVALELKKVDGFAHLIVTDNGYGMTEEVLKHLFEPFFTRRRDGQGTGLGLSITYRIVADHGGTIAAESEGPDCGSRFRVTLPLVSHEKEKKQRLAVA